MRLEATVLISEYRTNIKRIIAKISILYMVFLSSFFISMRLGMMTFIIIAGLILLCSKSTIDSISTYIAILPLANLIILNGDYNKSYFFVLTFLLVVRLLIFQKINISLIFIYVIFSLYIITGSIYKGGISFTGLLSLMNYLPIVFLCTKYSFTNYKTIVISGTTGLVLSSIIGGLKNSIPSLNVILRSSTVLIGGYDTGRFSGLAYDTNFYGVWCAFFISLLVLLVSKVTNKFEKRIYLMLVFILLFLGMLTYSKAFFLTIFLVFILYLIFVTKLNPFKIFLSFSFLFILDKLLVKLVDFSVQEFIESRFIEKATNLTSFTTHRNLLWKEYLDFSFSSKEKFLYGAGMNNPIISKQVAHNFYIEVLYLFGLIGLTLFVLFWIYYFIKMLNLNKKNINIYSFSPMLTFLFIAFSLNFFNVTETCMFLFLSVLSCTVSLKEEN